MWLWHVVPSGLTVNKHIENPAGEKIYDLKRKLAGAEHPALTINCWTAINKTRSKTGAWLNHNRVKSIYYSLYNCLNGFTRQTITFHLQRCERTPYKNNVQSGWDCHGVCWSVQSESCAATDIWVIIAIPVQRAPHSRVSVTGSDQSTYQKSWLVKSANALSIAGLKRKSIFNLPKCCLLNINRLIITRCRSIRSKFNWNWRAQSK